MRPARRAARKPGGRLARTATVVLRYLVSAAVLVVLVRRLDVDLVFERLRGLDPSWVVLGLGISVAQVLILAWRWRFTARRLGIDLRYRDALLEYWFGNLLNQLLPGGVTGDATRAWRHAKASDSTGPAVRAVVLERVTAQVLMSTVAVASLVSLNRLPASVRWGAAGVGAAAAIVLYRALAAGRSDPSTRSAREESIWSTMSSDAARALGGRWVFTIQLGSALVVVASYIGVYLVAAKAVGVSTGVATLLPLVAPVLMTMLVPVTVAGWGVREGAAAGLWGLVGLGPEDGVAISVSYGVIAFLGTLPGLVALLTSGRRRTDPTS